MMDKSKAQSLLMDYLYGEIDGNQKKELEELLKNDPDLRRELTELQETRSIIHKMPLREPVLNPIAVKPEQQGFSQWLRDVRRVFLPQSTGGRAAIALAAVLLITFLLASVAQLQITSDEAGWTVAFGSEPAVIQQGVDEETLNEIVALLRQENLTLATTMMEENRRQNELYMQEAVDVILQYLEEQRRNDLQMVARELLQMEEESYYRYLQTNETIGELLYAIQQDF